MQKHPMKPPKGIQKVLGHRLYIYKGRLCLKPEREYDKSIDMQFDGFNGVVWIMNITSCYMQILEYN